MRVPWTAAGEMEGRAPPGGGGTVETRRESADQAQSPVEAVPGELAVQAVEPGLPSARRAL